jgi:hypothetical protein
MSSDICDPPWRLSSKKACWCWHNEITDQELLSIIKPEKGFEIEHKGYHYSVIVNDNGTIAVIRKQQDSINSQNIRSSKTFLPEKDSHSYSISSRIVDIRLVPPDKILDIVEDESWEISEYNPVCKIKDEIVVILIKRQGRNTRTSEASH